MRIRNNKHYKRFELTDTDISISVKALKNVMGMNHESPDSVRIAVEWLSAQRRTAKISAELVNIKHLIENWGGRYVSRGDVQVAALLLNIEGIYPCFRLDLSSLVLPDNKRLIGIAEAHSQEMYRLTNGDSISAYRIKEVIE